MFLQPGAGFAGGERMSGHVRRRGGKLGNQLFAIEVKHLCLGDVGDGIEIEQIARRAVGFVACQEAVVTRPLRPKRQRNLSHQIGDGFAIVAFHAGGAIIRLAAEQGRELVLQTIAPPLFKLREEVRRPVGLVLVRILILRARHRTAVGRERLIEPAQVICHRPRVKQVEHPALAAGGGALHLLGRGFLGNGKDPPGTPFRRPVHLALRSQPGEQIHFFAVRTKGHQCLNGFGLKCLRQVRSAGDFDLSRDDAGVGILRRDPGAAKTPAGARGHVHAKTQAVGFGDRVAQHLHPLRTEIGDVIRFPAFRAVDRNEVDAAQAGIAVAREFLRDIGRVHRAAHHPPISPRFLKLGNRRPGKRHVGGRGGGDKACEREGEQTKGPEQAK